MIKQTISHPSYLYHIAIKSFNYPPSHFIGINYVSPASLQVKRSLFRPKLMINWREIQIKLLDKTYQDIVLPLHVPISFLHQHKLHNLLKNQQFNLRLLLGSGHIFEPLPIKVQDTSTPSHSYLEVSLLDTTTQTTASLPKPDA